MMNEIIYIRVNKIRLRFLVMIIGFIVAIIGIFFLIPFERSILNIIGAIIVVSGLIFSISAMLSGTVH